MSSLQSLLPDFSDDEKKRLHELGIVDEQIAELRYALVIVRVTIAPKATMNGTKALLGEIRYLSNKLDRKLMSLFPPLSAEHNLTHGLLEERYWLLEDRQDDIGPTIPTHLIPRVRALSACASDALDSLPSNPTRNRSADPAPIKRIVEALGRGWSSGQSYPAELRPSAADGSVFRAIVGICYEAVRGNADPLAAIKAYLRAERESHKEAMAALEAGISLANKKGRNRTSRKT